MKQGVGPYLAWLSRPFFRWWWAVITGVVTLIAFGWSPQGVTVPRVGVLVAVVAGSALLFLTLAVLGQGWRLYLDRTRPFEVVALQKVKNRDLGSDWVLVLQGRSDVDVGCILQVSRRLHDGVEVPFAIVKTSGKNASGLYQSVPIWLSPGHLNDFKKHGFSVASLLVERHPTLDCIRRALRDMEQSSDA